MTPEQNAHVKTLSTREEIFKHVEKHLIHQGRRSVTQHRALSHAEVCRYRGDLGDMCAVGCLIADDEYASSMESSDVYDLLDARRTARATPPAVGPMKNDDSGTCAALIARLNPHVEMLADFQEFHDYPHNWHPEGGLSDRGLYSLEGLRRMWGVN